MAAKDELGRAGEERASRYLTTIGYEIVERNWRCAFGEIDIVAVRDRWLSIVEVKTRSSTRYGHPFEALDDRKVRRLWRLGHAWIAAHPDVVRHSRVRLEAVAIIGTDPDTGVLEHLVDLR